MAGGGLGRAGFALGRGILSAHDWGVFPLVNEEVLPTEVVEASDATVSGAGTGSTAPKATGTLDAAKVGCGDAGGGPPLAMAVVGATFNEA